MSEISIRVDEGKDLTMKNTKVLGVVTVGVAALSSGIVHAEDSIPTSVVQEKEVTQEMLDQAKQAADIASEQVKNQEAVVSQVGTETAAALQQVDQAQAAVVETEGLVAEATPENIAQTKTAINTTSNEIKTAAEQLETAQDAAEEANKSVSANEQAVAEKQAAVDGAKGDLTDAQTAEANAQAVLDGTNTADIYKHAEETKKAAEVASNEAQAAQKELAEAKQVDEQRSQAIESASQKVSVLDGQLSVAKNRLNEASLNKETLDQKVSEAQLAFTKAENDVAAINTITLSPEYVKALRDYSSSEIGSDDYHAAEETLARLSTELRKVNQFKANKNDLSTETYDLNNLPTSVLTELSLFTSDLLNQIHQQIGTSPTVVTPSSIAFADKVTDQAVESNWDTWDQSHNEEGITAVAKTYHLVASDKVGNYYEDWAGLTNMSNTSYTVPDLTVSQLKQKIYESLLMFFFPTDVKEWQHAADLAGTKVSLLGYEGKVKESYVAVDFSRIGEHSGIHFITVNDVMLTSKSDFDTTPILQSKTPEVMKSTLEKAKSNLVILKEQQVKAQKLLSDEQASFEALTSQLIEAKDQLLTVKQIPLQTPAARQVLSSSQERLAKAKAANEKAQADVKQLSADMTSKKVALEQAKQVVKEKQGILTQALVEQQIALAAFKDSQKDLEAKQAVVQNLETQRQRLKVKLEQQQERLQQYKNAPKLLAAAKKQLEGVKVSVERLNQQLAIEQKRLDELKATEAELVTRYQLLTSRYQKALEAKAQANLIAKRQLIESQGGLATPVFDETGKVVDYVSQIILSNQTQITASKTDSLASKQTASALPATGDSVSLFSLLSGSFLALLSLLGIRKSQNN